MPKTSTSLNDLLHEIRRIEESREVLTEKKIRSIYKQLLKELTAFVAETYTKYSDGNGMLTVSDLQRSAKLAWFLSEIDKNCNEYLPDVSKEIQKLIDTVYEECYVGMVEAVNQAYDLSALNVRPEVMKSTISNNIEKLTLPALLEKNRKEIVYEIKQTVSIGLMNGERYDTMSRRLVERLDFSYGKANNVVRTETHRNVEAGIMDGALETQKALSGSGLVHTATWRTMEDERVRPQHRYHTKSGWKTKISGKADHTKMEGVTIIVGDKFKLEPNVYAPCPGMSGTARNDCRCRCFLEYDLLTLAEWEALPNKQENFISAKSLDKSGKSGIIRAGSGDVSLEYQRYGRNKDTLVNKTYIDSGEYRRKFDNLTDNADVNKTLYDCAKTALKHRSGTEFEDMYWIDGNTGKIIAREISSFDKRAVSYSDKTRKAVQNNTGLLALHTHPSSMPPSIADFNSCWRNKYKIGYIICHNGKIFAYTSECEISERLYSLYIDKFLSDGKSEFDAQIAALNKLKINHAINFWEVD